MQRLQLIHKLLQVRTTGQFDGLYRLLSSFTTISMLENGFLATLVVYKADCVLVLPKLRILL